MKALTRLIQERPEIKDTLDALKRRKVPVWVTGCPDTQKGFVLHAIFEKSSKKRLVLASNSLNAMALFNRLKANDRNTYYYPDKDLVFYYADVHNNILARDRINAISHLIEDDEVTIVASFESLLEKHMPIKRFKESILNIEKDKTEISIDDLRERLLFLGYSRNEMIEAEGQFCIRGGIVDIYPFTEENPVRIEFWGDEINDIRYFDIESQRMIQNINSIKIYPACEFLLTKEEKYAGLEKIDKELDLRVKQLSDALLSEEAFRLNKTISEFKEGMLDFNQMQIEGKLDYFYDRTESFADYFDNDTLVVIDEVIDTETAVETNIKAFEQSLEGRVNKGYILPRETHILYEYKQVFSILTDKKLMYISSIDGRFSSFKEREKNHLGIMQGSNYFNNEELLYADLLTYSKQKFAILLVLYNEERTEAFAEKLRENKFEVTLQIDAENIPEKGEMLVVKGTLEHGFIDNDNRLVVITENDISTSRERKKFKVSEPRGRKLSSLDNLTFGDYVVDERFGIGIYRGIVNFEDNGTMKDKIKVEYASNGAIYIDPENFHRLSKYASKDTAQKPALSNLNSQKWNKTRDRVKKEVSLMAKELVELYAKRQRINGFRYDVDDDDARGFESAFPFEETEDQIKAIWDVKQDMESDRIMDRLVCGDVGFGKTEVAIRAAFKAVNSGKQVAVLAPTTILAGQHYNTFSKRFANTAIHVEMLSRLKSPAQQKAALEAAKTGKADILVGTHRILSKDVEFKDLGLLIVDEEQRFGVAQKERIKLIKNEVDVLTLTATPIPRTLHMSLIGVRDMSMLKEPPIDRLPIQTFVLEHDEEMIREAISRELARNGQVYYVYNRVDGIERVAARIMELVPDARVSFAHGQMSERELERIMYSFINGDIDVLVSTTIIETGLDIPNVNTIIVDNAENFGLSQLYQLRGRVGRSNRLAYAFMMYKRDKLVSEVASKRLEAIKEFTDLGSGVRIAMRDLEIRGAGSILGFAQSGQVEEVGYDLYCKLLEQAIEYEKTGKRKVNVESQVKINVDAMIPVEYIGSEKQRLDLYKDISEITSKEERYELIDEIIDRYGEDIPQKVVNLINVSLIRALCEKCYITRMTEEEESVSFVIDSKAPFDYEKLESFIKEYAKAKALEEDKKKGISPDNSKAEKSEKNLKKTANLSYNPYPSVFRNNISETTRRNLMNLRNNVIRTNPYDICHLVKGTNPLIKLKITKGATLEKQGEMLEGLVEFLDEFRKNNVEE
ncbi:MAG: transcription-repair coupling factor [Lachnospiraceae bacterium]|nr:transcription-repair coupling factor [Lachnospiraceae bacterium]